MKCVCWAGIRGTLHPGHLTVNNGDQRWPLNGRQGTVNANYISVIRGQLLSILSPKVHIPLEYPQVNIRIPFPISLSFVSLCQVINQSVSNIISEPPPPPALVTSSISIIQLCNTAPNILLSVSLSPLVSPLLVNNQDQFLPNPPPPTLGPRTTHKTCRPGLKTLEPTLGEN